MASRKIQKPGGKQPDEFELKVAEEIYKLETASSDLKADLEKLYIMGAKEVSVAGAKKAVIIMVPYVLMNQFRKVHSKLIRELEKKLAGKHVVIIAHRTIYGDSYNRDIKTKGVRPRNRTLTSVQEAMLEDIVYPVEIVGKRTRFSTDGKKHLKVYLQPRDQMNAETKLD